MSEYLDLIKIYYNEKLLFLTKDKHKKCNECENDKQFKEIYGELVLNCGDKSGSKCGDKIKIKLPIYKSDKDLLYFKNSLENSINWEIISKYININEKDKSDNIKLKENYEKELSSIKELFNKYNSKNINTIKEKYSQIIELKNKSKTISNQMKLPENLENINVLKKEYIEYSNDINKLTREIGEVNDSIEYYFMTEEPKILSKEYKHEGPVKKKKKKEKKVVEPKKKGKPKEDTFKKGDDVKWMSGNKELTGKIDNITSKSYIICCKPDGKMYRVKKELVSLNMEEKPDEDESSEEESQEEPVQEEEPQEEKPVEITMGSKVKWIKEGKELNGEVENITSKSYIICCKPDGKKYRVPKELVSLV
jgi:hypothetical protein